MAHHSSNQLVDPYLLFDKAQLRAAMHVADFGCGRTGHIVFPAALVVGERGIVYAVDILKEVLEDVSKRARQDGLTQLHPVWANIELPGKISIPDQTLDVIFLVNNLCLSDKRHDILAAASRLLQPKARIVIVDWKACTLSFCPPQERLVDFQDLTVWARTNGFVVQEEFSVGKYHHGMVIYKGE